jgi:hypothetical protein
MKANSIYVLLGVITISMIGHPAQGQVAGGERKGFWFAGGLGYGSAIVTCDGCTGPREGAASGYLVLGGTVNPHFLLGGESDLWIKSVSGVTLTLGTITLTGYFYPSRTGGFFVKAGVGAALSEATAGDQSESHGGPGGLIGIGYDIPAGRKVAIVPYASWNVGSLGSIGEFGTAKENTLQIGLGVKVQ